MAEKRAFTAVNDTLTVDIPTDAIGTLTASIMQKQTDGVTDVAATAAAVLEVSPDGGTTWVTPVRMRNPVANADLDSLVGPAKSGWADCPGYDVARLRCTVFAGTDIPCRLDVR